MKTKIFAFTLVLVLSLVIAVPALGAYSNLVGAVYSGTSGGTPWTHGGTVTVYFLNSSDQLEACGSDHLDASGNYSVDLSSCGASMLHIVQLDITAAANGDPDSQVRAFYNTGTGDLSMYWYTNSGPTAVTLQSLTATQAGGNWLAPGVLAALIALAGSAIYAFRRTRA